MYSFGRVHAGGTDCWIEASQSSDRESGGDSGSESLNRYVHQPALSSGVSAGDSRSLASTGYSSQG